ncbi:MAG: glycosyltransferase [Bacteroidota bacterium]
MHIGVIADPRSFHTQKWTKGLLETSVQVTVFSFSSYQLGYVPCVYIQPVFGEDGSPSYLSFLLSGKRLRKALKAHQVDIANPINITPYGVWADMSGFRPMGSVAMGADIFEYPPKGISRDIPLQQLWGQVEALSLTGKITSTIKQPIFRRLVKRALQHSDFITGDNLQLVYAVRDWFEIAKEKVHLNRWGIEEELFQASDKRLDELRKKYGILPNQKVVLSPRGLKPIYQGELLLDTVAELLKEGTEDVKYILFSAGYGISSRIVEKGKAMESQYPNLYIAWDLIPREEVCALWNLVDVFISAPVYDGYSNALSEGRYIGALPIVNDIPAHQELILHGENGFVVEPFDVPGLKEQIREVLEQLDTHKEKMVQTNRDWILENAHLPTNMKTFVELCRQAIR